MFRLCHVMVMVLLIGGCALDGGRPSAVRRITQTSATSDCIGDPKTPLCAVETFRACFARQDRSLCRLVGQPDVQFVGGAQTVEYIVGSIEAIRAADISADEGHLFWKKAGNQVIDVAARYCPVGRNVCPDESWTYYSYVVGQAPGQWNIVSWYSENDWDPDDFLYLPKEGNPLPLSNPMPEERNDD